MGSKILFFIYSILYITVLYSVMKFQLNINQVLN